MVANTTETRTWSFPTSPRSPYKIQSDLRELAKLEGQIWSRTEGQLAYAKLLSSSPDFEGDGSKNDPSFSGRERTRAIKILGLASLPNAREKGPVSLTDAGRYLLTLDPQDTDHFFLRQIAKVQFPSKQHHGRSYSGMNIKPLTLCIAVLEKVESLTKDEIALFLLSCVDHRSFQATVNAILEYRIEISAAKAGLDRKNVRKAISDRQVRSIYRADIENGATALRQGGTDFVKTKRATLNDYADSAIRYLLSTGLFRLKPNGQSLQLRPERVAEAHSIKNQLGLDATYSNSAFGDFADTEYDYSYLGSLSFPALESDSEGEAKQNLDQISMEAGIGTTELNKLKAKIESCQNDFERAREVENAFSRVTAASVLEKSIAMTLNRKESTHEIVSLYAAINQNDVIDRPLMYEWNAWRLLTVMNDALSVIGNFKTDAAGNPISHAAGGKPDIVAEYQEFWLACEVTLSRGAKQYEMEGEPVQRHIGQLQHQVLTSEAPKPVFGFFVAEQLNPSVLVHFYTIAHLHLQQFSGPVRVVPIARKSFEKWLLNHENAKFTNSSHLFEYFKRCFSSEAISGGELSWSTRCDEWLQELKCVPLETS